MRCVPILLLLVPAVILNAAAPPPVKAPRLDVNGDPLPDGVVARLGTVRFQPRDRYEGMVTDWYTVRAFVALSSDGTTLAAARNNGNGPTQIDFMDTSTGKTVRKLDLADVSGIRQMHFTSDGKHLVFNGWSGIQMVDLRTGRVGKAIELSRPCEYCIAFTRDGKWVAGQPSKYVKHAPVVVSETKSGKEVMSLPGQGASCEGITFGPDGKRLLLWSLVPASVSDKEIVFDSDGKAALACIDVPTRKIVAETTVGRSQLIALCPDGETVAIGSADHQYVRIHHLPTRTDRCVIAAKFARFVFAPDGKTLFAIDDEGRAALWDTKKGGKLRDLEGTLIHKYFEFSGISSDGRTITVVDGGGYSAGRFVVWNAATGKRVGRPEGHAGTVTCIAYTSDGRLLVSGSIDRTVRLWDAATGRHIRVLSVHKEAITAVAISPDGKLVASSSRSGVTRLSHVADGKTVTEFTGAEEGATAMSFSQDGKRLFVGIASPEVLAYDVASGKEVMRLKTGDDGAVMGFGDGGTLAVTANGEFRNATMRPRLRLWDLTNQRPSASLMLENRRDKLGNPLGSVWCGAACFSPDGHFLASSQVTEVVSGRVTYDYAQLRLWERVSGQPIRTLGPVITRVLAFSPNGRFLASTGAGERGQQDVGYGSGVDVWDILTGEKAGALPVTPQCIAFSPDGTHMATGGRDHCVLIWQVPKVQRRMLAKTPSPTERDAWWAALGGDAPAAYKVIGQLVDAPERALPMFKERVHPVPIGYALTVAKLIDQLGSEVFGERESAERVLEEMGQDATPLLTKAIQGKVDLELRRRVERLLKKSEEISTNYKRYHRAVLTLEWIGTPASRALLRTLADGAPSARLTLEARAALKRAITRAKQTVR